MHGRRPRRRVVVGAAGLCAFLALGLPLFVEAGGARPTGVAAVADADRTVQVATVSEPEPVPPVPEPVTEAEAPPEAPPAQVPPAADPCTEALTWVAEAGLPLPPGVGYHCPSTEFAHHGAACWYTGPCPQTAFIAVNLDLMAGTGTPYLRHVVAHEVCHILDFRAGITTSETGADACAAAHGAPA